MSRYRWILPLLALIPLVLTGCSPIQPPQPDSVPNRILFIGTGDTEVNQGIDKHLQGMAASSLPPLSVVAECVAVREAPLAQLWHSLTVLNKIEQGDWDVVVVEGEFALGDSEDEQSYLESVHKFDELIRSAGARPVLFMDWPVTYDGNVAELFSPPQIEEIAQTVAQAGAENHSEVAPVGLAFARAMAEKPDLDLYDADGKSPNAHGTYLATAVFYATLFQRNPEGLSYGLEDILPEQEFDDEIRAQYTIPDEEKTLMQRIAWETVQEYQAQREAAP